MNQTPAQAGYAMPAEWERHEATWLAFPRDAETFLDLESVRRTLVEIMRRLLPGERIDVFVADQEEEEWIRRRLDDEHLGRRLICHQRATADCWIRDYGPTFLQHRETGQAAMADFRFNAWGGKYPELLVDDGVPAVMEKLLGIPRFRADFVLEGGSIEVNGQGLCMITEQCLLNPNRNPDLSRSDIERRLRDWLGVTEIIWLGEGIAGDDTDGHIDTIARFVSSDTVLCAVERDPADRNYRPLQDNLERLRKFRDSQGRRLKVATVPMPEPIGHEGRRLPASSVNFYMANECVLVPVFGDSGESAVPAILQDLLKGRQIAPVHSRDVVVGLGSLHCLTQQQPAVGVRQRTGIMQ